MICDFLDERKGFIVLAKSSEMSLDLHIQIVFCNKAATMIDYGYYYILTP